MDDLLVGHAAAVEPLEEDDDGLAPAGREVELARLALEQDAVAQLRELAVDEHGALAVLDDDGVDPVIVAQVGLGAGTGDGERFGHDQPAIAVVVSCWVEHVQFFAVLAG